MENEYINKVLLLTKKFIRENNEYKIELDFNTKKIVYNLKDNNITFSTEFNGNIDIKSDEIRINYNIDEDDLLIVIHLL